MTTLTFHLARALGRRWGPGDEVVVTELDHHANVDPWRALERERGVTVRVARMIPETGQTRLGRPPAADRRADAAGGRSGRPRTPWGRSTTWPRSPGWPTPSAPWPSSTRSTTPRTAWSTSRAWDCDFLACSAYKFYGPHVGVLYGKHDLLQALDVPKLRPAPDTAPERLETGTQNHEGIVGAAAAVEFLASLADGPTRAGIASGSPSRPSTSGGRPRSSGSGGAWPRSEACGLYGPPPSEPRTPTVSFVVDGIPSAEVCRRLADRGLFASHGDFYATTAVERLGLLGRAWCGSAAPATPPRRRSSGCSTA